MGDFRKGFAAKRGEKRASSDTCPRTLWFFASKRVRARKLNPPLVDAPLNQTLGRAGAAAAVVATKAANLHARREQLRDARSKGPPRMREILRPVMENLQQRQRDRTYAFARLADVAISLEIFRRGAIAGFPPRPRKRSATRRITRFFEPDHRRVIGESRARSKI